jgi:hypothetical protein
MFKNIVLVFLTLMPFLGFSQSTKVVDSCGEPLAFATIEIPSKDTLVYTDIDGFFNLEVPENTEIIVSYISYEEKKVLYKKEDLIVLEEYVINL